MRISALFLTLIVASGCGRGALSVTTAEAAFHAIPEAATLPLTLTDVSQDGTKPEAMALATIAGHDVRLAFRRYDSGWRCEEVLGADGTRVAVADFVSRVRDEIATANTIAWSKTHLNEYAETAALFSELEGNLIRKPSEPLNAENWAKLRDLSLAFMRTRHDDEAEAIVRRQSTLADGWGTKAIISFANDDRQAIFRSAGPDKIMDSQDDLVCLVKGVREWDDFYSAIMWNYVPTCRGPHGIEAAIKSAWPSLQRRGAFAGVSIEGQ